MDPAVAAPSKGAEGQLPGRPSAVPLRVDRRALVVATVLAVTALVSGIGLVGVSILPDSDHIMGEPWLLVLATNHVGVEFITYGRDFSAVQYGVIDSGGSWVVGPKAITGRYGYHLYPSGARAISDSMTRVHVAWTLFDPTVHEQSFYYLQLDALGQVVAAVGPLGNRSVPTVYDGPNPPGIQASNSTVEVTWADEGTYWAATLDLNGRLVRPAHPLPGNVTGTPRVPAPLPGAFASTASVGSDGAGATYYVWQQSRYRQVGRQSLLEYEIRLYRTGPGGEVDRILYSTDDFWWTTGPLVVPGVVLILMGTVVLPVVVSVLVMRERHRKDS